MSGLVGLRIIDVRKITDYLLDPNHQDGRHKERFFASFGFRQADDTLKNALDLHATETEIVKTSKSVHGIKTVLRCNLRTPDGRNPCICSVWIEENNSGVQKFITAYPA